MNVAKTPYPVAEGVTPFTGGSPFVDNTRNTLSGGGSSKRKSVGDEEVPARKRYATAEERARNIVEKLEEWTRVPNAQGEHDDLRAHEAATAKRAGWARVRQEALEKGTPILTKLLVDHLTAHQGLPGDTVLRQAEDWLDHQPKVKAFQYRAPTALSVEWDDRVPLSAIFRILIMSADVRPKAIVQVGGQHIELAAWIVPRQGTPQPALQICLADSTCTVARVNNTEWELSRTARPDSRSEDLAREVLRAFAMATGLTGQNNGEPDVRDPIKVNNEDMQWERPPHLGSILSTLLSRELFRHKANNTTSKGIVTVNVNFDAEQTLPDPTRQRYTAPRHARPLRIRMVVEHGFFTVQDNTLPPEIAFYLMPPVTNDAGRPQSPLVSLNVHPVWLTPSDSSEQKSRYKRLYVPKSMNPNPKWKDYRWEASLDDFYYTGTPSSEHREAVKLAATLGCGYPDKRRFTKDGALFVWLSLQAFIDALGDESDSHAQLTALAAQFSRDDKWKGKLGSGARQTIRSSDLTANAATRNEFVRCTAQNPLRQPEINAAVQRRGYYWWLDQPWTNTGVSF